MINLLPPELKASYRYAHRNLHLLRWLIAFGIGLAGLIAISTAGIIYLHQTTQSYTAQIAEAQSALSKQNLGATQTQVKDMGDSLKLAVQVLSKEVLFSKLLAQLAVVMPSNTVLTDLNISKTQGGVDIAALTTDYASATQLQVNLADPNNKIFSRADIVSVTCQPGSSDPTEARYPCSVSIRALFGQNNPFLLINDQGVKNG